MCCVKYTIDDGKIFGAQHTYLVIECMFAQLSLTSLSDWFVDAPQVVCPQQHQAAHTRQQQQTGPSRHHAKVYLARSAAVKSSRSLLLTSQRGCFISTLTTSTCSASAARCKAVRCCHPAVALTRQSGCCSNALTASACPASAATCNAARPRRSNGRHLEKYITAPNTSLTV